MFKFLNNMPIFRRLFIIFGLATIIPVVVILVLGNFYLSSLNQRSQAVATSSLAQSIASNEQNGLLSMNALMEDLNNNTFAKASNVVQDPSLGASGSTIASQITAREIHFQETLQSYGANYEIGTSPNMGYHSYIIQHDAQSNPRTVIQDQANALDNVIETDWPTVSEVAGSCPCSDR